MAPSKYVAAPLLCPSGGFPCLARAARFHTVHLLGAGLSSEDIAYVLPCAVGEAPELPGCPELLAAMRSRLRRLEDQMDRLARSRDALADYIAAAERTGSENYPPFDGADLERVPA